jgi:hypothetical protein
MASRTARQVTVGAGPSRTDWGPGVAGSNPVVPTRSEALSERSGTASASFDDSSDDNVAVAIVLVVVFEQNV